VRVPEEPRAVEPFPHDLKPQAFPVELLRVVAQLGVPALEVARMGRGVAHQLGGGRLESVDSLQARPELGIGFDLRGRAVVAFTACREDQVVTLAPHRHRGPADHVVRPGEPGDEQQRRTCRRDADAKEPFARRSWPERRREDRQRRGEDEDRADEREGARERAAERPPQQAPLPPGPRERVHARERDRARENLRKHEWHIVLRPRVYGVEQAARQGDGLTPPAAHRQHQQPRADSEEQRLPHERERVVVVEDLLVAEEREEERVGRRAEHLALLGLPGLTRQARAGDVEPALGIDVDEGGLQRCRVRAVADRVRGRDVRPAVGPHVRRDEWDVEQAVQASGCCEQEREAPERHAGAL